jgi:hypothetical protein
VTSCDVVVGYQRFGGPCRLHLQNPEDLDLKWVDIIYSHVLCPNLCPSSWFADVFKINNLNEHIVCLQHCLSHVVAAECHMAFIVLIAFGWYDI